MTASDRESPRALFLFDIDGTLLRGAGPQHRNALLEGVRRITGDSVTFDGIQTAGRLDRDLIVALVARTNFPRDRWGDALPELTEECRRAYAADCHGDLHSCVAPGVRTFLDRARAAGLVLGVVSGNLRSIDLQKLERAGLDSYFCVHGFSEDGKTRSELARVAADEAREQCGLDEWAPTFLVGDHLNDIEAARTNGFYSIAVATGVLDVQQLQAAEPTLAVPDLTSLHPADLVVRYRGR